MAGQEKLRPSRQKSGIRSSTTVSNKTTASNSTRSALMSGCPHNNADSRAREAAIKKRKSAAKRKRKKRLFQLALILFLFPVLSLLFLGAGAFGIVYSYVKEAPPFNPGDLHSATTSYVFDRNGVELAGLYGEQNRIQVSLEAIPEHVINAFIAIEDERFYQHAGVDPNAITRAFITNLQQRSWTEQGGSTITQQLIKNAFLTPEKTMRRKVQEAWFSLQLERLHTKDEILEMYLNQIYFAHGAYGIEAAAQVYFGQSAGDLSVAEGAMLAGIPRSPNYYSPYHNPEAAKQRQSLVLAKMYELGFIDHEQLQEARNEELFFAEPPSRDYPFPYFLDYVLHHELISIITSMPQYSSREEAYEVIYQAGLRIYTTLDPEIQQAAEDILNDESLYPQQTVRVDMGIMKQLLSEAEYSGYPEEVLQETGIPQPQSAAVVAHPVTGEVLALVGGREYSGHNQDLRYLSRRQPGSAAKPIISYAAALETNMMTPGSVIDDSPFVRGSWAPANFDRRFRGMVTVREALVRSLNIPAIRTLEQVTPELGLEYARKMGISTIHPGDYNLATAIGGMTHGVTAFDMAQAYAVLAYQGRKKTLHTVQRIKSASGEIIYEYHCEPEQVLSPQTAFLITDMLIDTVRRGTAARLQVGRPVAAKTGTTSDNRDACLVAYTPDLVVSFWMGHDIQRLGRIQGGSASTIVFMNRLITQIKGDAPAVVFERPPNISGFIRICSKSGLRPGPNCPSSDLVSEIFPTHLIPQGTCSYHLMTKEPDYADLQPAPKPSGLSAYLLYSPPRAHLWWDRDHEVAKYLLYRQASGEQGFTRLSTLPGSENQFLDANLLEGREYTYHLFALSQEGLQSEPAAWNIKVLPASGESHDSSSEKPQPPVGKEKVESEAREADEAVAEGEADETGEDEQGHREQREEQEKTPESPGLSEMEGDKESEAGAPGSNET